MGTMTNPVDFLAEVTVELEKVVWPTRQQTIKLTIIVIMVTIIVGFFIVAIDFVFQRGVELLIKL